MINTLERVSTVVTDNANSIKLQIKENKLVISAISKEFGKAIDELDVDFNSEQEFQICFNSKYLLELIKQIKTDNFQILFNNSSSPTLIKPLDSNSKVDSIFVIMPVEIISN